MQISDQEILNLIQNPHSKEMGFRQLIQVYQKRVYHVIRRLVIIHEDADDLTQNTFIKAYHHIHKFESKSGLFTWLYDEIQLKLQKTLLKLPEKQRLVFHLKYQEDLSYDEISAITGTSVGALKASYHHAVKKIEEIISNQ